MRKFTHMFGTHKGHSIFTYARKEVTRPLEKVVKEIGRGVDRTEKEIERGIRHTRDFIAENKGIATIAALVIVALNPPAGFEVLAGVAAAAGGSAVDAAAQHSKAKSVKRKEEEKLASEQQSAQSALSAQLAADQQPLSAQSAGLALERKEAQQERDAAISAIEQKAAVLTQQQILVNQLLDDVRHGATEAQVAASLQQLNVEGLQLLGNQLAVGNPALQEALNARIEQIIGQQSPAAAAPGLG